MKSEKLDRDKHYRTVCHWWESHGWPILLWDGLPKNGLFVSDETGRGICAGWVCLTDANIAWLWYSVKNPEMPFAVSDPALELLTNELCAIAKEHGHTVVFTTTGNEAQGARYERMGFSVGDQKVTHYLRGL